MELNVLLLLLLCSIGSQVGAVEETLMDTRTATAELGWTANPSSGRVPFLQRTISLFARTIQALNNLSEGPLMISGYVAPAIIILYLGINIFLRTVQWRSDTFDSMFKT